MSGSASPLGAEILRLEGITRRYGGAEAAALSGVDLVVHEGEFLAVVGASGAGKSTLLNILGLLDRPSEGDYFVTGTSVGDLAEGERDRLRASVFGFVFQDSHMLARETAGGNAALGLRINRVDPRARPGIVARALSIVGLGHKAQELAGNLSGGERQRVAIARAIATEPRIVLADEPTGALDTANSERMIDTLRELNRGGVTVIMITHDPMVARAAERVVEISDGRIVSDRTASESHRAAGLGPAPARDTAPAVPTAPSDGDDARVGAQGRWSRGRERILAALSSHTVHAARAGLLLAAFTIGSAGLVAASGLSQSAAAQVVDRLDSAALAEFLVVPKTQPDAIRAELNLAADAPASRVAEAVRPRLSALAGVERVGMLAGTHDETPVAVLDPMRVSAQPQPSPPVFVADEHYLRMSGVRVKGSQRVLRMFVADAPASTLSAAPAVLVGSDLASKLGITAGGPGAQLWLGSVPVAVAGVIERTGTEPRFASALVGNFALDRHIFVSDPTFLVRTLPGRPAQLAELAGVAVAPGDGSLFQPEIVADLRGLKQGVASDLVSLINMISWVLLVLSALSAATAAYLSVHARSAEIALRRAIGESRRSIWLQFVLEGLTVGFFGGVLGSALGVILLVAIATAQGWAPIFDPAFLMLGVLSGSVTGVLASLYPAAVAARQEPALAVRGT